ncbi:hypothetical protein Misp02_05410 [Microtetraspora sp. NBRC 16547]|nr:hypothetical protein Misp02_05410 [Microtetraspora sp. NBRC 16547]
MVASIPAERMATLMRELFVILSEHSDAVHKDVVIKELRRRHPPRPAELEPTSGDRDVYSHRVEWGVTDVSTGSLGNENGWATKMRGPWAITQKGRQALAMYVDAEVFWHEARELRRRYKRHS